MSREAHAGCLSFEFSRGAAHRGQLRPAGDQPRDLAPVARATAAHSTVAFNDTSSCRFLDGGSLKRLLGAPILGGPADVQVVARGARRTRIILRALA